MNKSVLFILIALLLAGCIGETKQAAMGACQIEVAKIPPAQRTKFDFVYIAHCMEARGYRLQITGSDCPLEARSGEDPLCYIPTTIRNSLAQYLPSW